MQATALQLLEDDVRLAAALGIPLLRYKLLSFGLSSFYAGVAGGALWGGLIGLRWACEHPDAVEALVISSTGFFPDGKWHGMAKALSEPGTGAHFWLPRSELRRTGDGFVLSGTCSPVEATMIESAFSAPPIIFHSPSCIA